MTANTAPQRGHPFLDPFFWTCWLSRKVANSWALVKASTSMCSFRTMNSLDCQVPREQELGFGGVSRHPVQME